MIFNKSRFVAAVLVSALALPVFAQSEAKPTKPALPSQASLAHKGSFSTIAASDAGVKSAIAATNLTAAKAKLNKTATFIGTVTSVYAPKSGARVLLDFAKDYKTAVAGLVDATNFDTFPNLKQLKGKKVLISGKVMSFKEQTQIALTSPTSIKIVK